MAPATPTKKTTVLAVDDLPANLIALEAVLDSRDYHLIQAHSGAEAIAIVQQRHDLDVILMDLQMPGMDGFEAAAKIKQIPHARELPIIFITAIYREDPFVRKGYEAGAVDYFSKPFDPEILKMKINIYSSYSQKMAILRARETQIRESEELLKAGRKLSSVLEGLPVGVLIADTEGRICQANEAVNRILNATDITENDFYGSILGWWNEAGQFIKNHNGPLHRALHEGEETHSELVSIECVDGTRKTILGSASPLRAQDGHIVGAVAVIQDVTESKRIELDLEKRITSLVSIGVELEKTPGNDARH